MTIIVIDKLRATVGDLLAARGDRNPFSDTEPLFTAGRLDSLAATELIVALEQDYGLDLATADFDISALDTLRDLSKLVATVHS
ncbi:acyl carrier protein [Rhizobium sp. BK313]|jgi:acyl carrier protein|uniref:acyl carrier protein n=1 Tax=Rhizobium sp. BK313 TaxID=2587081 RepID=UPI00105F2422|nr:acyl carrier protein [Rhizobium sp. BK313]MBB3452136.1 acyl carrier protein [Rhizobium sp. BK313]